MAKIPIRVEQFDDEPAWSVLRRLARLSGTPNVRELCLDFGLDLSAIDRASDLTLFAHEGGYDLERLKKNSIKSLPTHFEFAGEQINKGGVFSGVSRVCPCCLDQDLSEARSHRSYAPHWRDWWFVKGIAACPFHCCEILTFSSGKHRGRMAPDILDPRQEVLSEKRLLTAGGVASDAYFLGRLSFMQPSAHWLLDSLSVGNGLKAVRKFGEAVTFGVQSLAADFDENEAHRLMSSGFEVLSSLSRLNEYLDSICRSSSPALIRKGPRAVYGSIFRWLLVERKTKNSGPAYDELREIVRQHSLNSFEKQPVEELFYDRSAIADTRKSSVQFDTVGMFEDHFRNKVNSIQPLERENDLLAPVLKGCAESNSMGSGSADYFGRSEFLRRYGVPIGTFLVLRDAGDLLPDHRGISARSGRKFWHREDVDAWFAKLSRDAPACLEAPSGSWSLQEISQRSQVSIDRIVRALLVGELRASALLSKAGAWQSIYVDVVAVRRRFGGTDVEGFVSRRAAVARLQTTHVIIEALIDQGHLIGHVLIGPTGIPKLGLEPATLEQFDREFIPPRAAAWFVGTAVKTLRRQLAERNIFPAIDLKTSPNAVFYRRSEVEALPGGSLRIYAG